MSENTKTPKPDGEPPSDSCRSTEPIDSANGKLKMLRKRGLRFLLSILVALALLLLNTTDAIASTFNLEIDFVWWKVVITTVTAWSLLEDWRAFALKVRRYVRKK